MAESGTHHFSDIDVWKHPDRSYYLFITLSVLFGFLGFDHFYLRSFGTGTQKLIVNLFTFGLWYFWDILQICFDGQKVRTEGLDSPFEWIRGIGRGVFIDPQEKLKMMSDPDKPIIRTRKDIVIYALLTIMFGIFGFDKLYMGKPWQAVTKFLSVFNILFFLFGLLWVLWDIVHVTLYPETILKAGITAPLPFSLIFDSFDVKDQFVPEEVTKAQLVEEAELFRKAWSMEEIKKSHFWVWNWDIWFWNWNVVRHSVGLPSNPPPVAGSIATMGPVLSIPENKLEIPNITLPNVTLPTVKLPQVHLPEVKGLPEVSEGMTTFRDDVFRPTYKELVVPVIQPTVQTALASSKEHEKTIAAATDLGKEVIASVPEITSQVTEKIRALSDPDAMIAKIKEKAAAKSVERMVGGGSMPTNGPIIAGTLSAIVLAGAGKAIVEMLSHGV